MCRLIAVCAPELCAAGGEEDGGIVEDLDEAMALVDDGSEGGESS